MKKLIFIIVFLLSLFYDTSQAQDSTNTVTLSVLCNLDDANIFLDSISLGKPPVGNFKTERGKYTLIITNPDASNKWAVENFKKEIEIVSDTTISINFAEFYYINSDPFNAEVFNNGALLGLTPLRLTLESPLSGELLFKKDQYVDETYRLSPLDTSRSIFVKLKENRYGQTNPIVFKNKETNFKTGRNFLAIGSLGVGTLISAVSAIYFKNQANNSYDVYKQTFNHSDLDDSNRYDVYSIVSLIIMQGAIGGLIYFLFFD